MLSQKMSHEVIINDNFLEKVFVFGSPPHDIYLYKLRYKITWGRTLFSL